MSILIWFTGLFGGSGNAPASPRIAPNSVTWSVTSAVVSWNKTDSAITREN